MLKKPKKPKYQIFVGGGRGGGKTVGMLIETIDNIMVTLPRGEQIALAKDLIEIEHYNYVAAYIKKRWLGE